MREFNINFNKALKPVLLAYIIFFAVGTALAFIWGVNLDINFSGGTKISYSYSGDIADKDIIFSLNKYLGQEAT